MLSKLLSLLSKPILIMLLILASYFAYNQYQAKCRIEADRDSIKKSFDDYKVNSKAIKVMESNIIEAIKNGQKETNDLRDSVDAGLVQLLVRVESIDRDSTTTSAVASQALRLAKSTQQSYYDLRNGIKYNKEIVDGWQQYYCLEIAPKNNTEFMCEQISKR